MFSKQNRELEKVFLAASFSTTKKLLKEFNVIKRTYFKKMGLDFSKQKNFVFLFFNNIQRCARTLIFF